MNRRRVLAIVAAVLLTVFGVVVIIAYVNAAEDRAQETAGLVRILVAAEEIPAGTPAPELEGRVAPREVPRSFRPEDPVTNIEELGRKETVERILEGEPIVERQFGEPGSTPPPGQPQLDEGREVITLTLEAQRALGGEVAAGDLVGVIVSLDDIGGDGETPIDETGGTGAGGQGCGETGMVLARVEVTDVSGAADPETGEAGGNAVTVSLNVDQPDAERLAFAAEYGSIWLTRQTDQSLPLDDDRQSCDTIFSG
jgi:pilus assembly protein CpaB